MNGDHAPHENAGAFDAQGLPQGDEVGTMAHGQPGQDRSVSTLQWVRHAEVGERLAEGWSVGQSAMCHHNEYAVLMVAP